MRRLLLILFDGICSIRLIDVELESSQVFSQSFMIIVNILRIMKDFDIPIEEILTDLHREPKIAMQSI